MRIVQTVFGVFHHFELAHQLERRGHLEAVFSTWPWQRLQREGLPRNKVRTFPWIHTPEYLLRRAGLLSHWLDDQLGYANALSFDEYTLRRIPPCDALIAISGSSLKTGQLVQQRGGIFLCDRGSAHQRYQAQIVSEEFRRWGITAEPSDIRDTIREEKIYAQADGIVVPSSFAARSFAEMGVDPAKVHVIPYGVRLDHFQPIAEPLASSTFEVLYAGAVSLRKGFPYLLQAFARLDLPRKRLRVIGSISREIKALLTQLPQANVEYLGSLPQQELAQIMARSHVMVLPSIEEGLALVQAQAMASGCPVIASTNTGSEDLFTDGVEGFIIPVRDPDAITDRLTRLAADSALQQQMRQACLHRIQSIGGWETYGDQWETLLHRLTVRQTK